ncbi:MAG: hypothetical protein ABIJ81_01520 [Patescibacteria group bacterium]
MWSSCKILALGILVNLIWVLPASSASTIFLLPTSGLYTKGSLITVEVKLATGEYLVNEVGSTISFDKSKLRVTKLETSDSIISDWPVEPTFANSKGKVTFVGIIKEGGYVGDETSLVSITFKTISLGKAIVQVSEGYVKATNSHETNLIGALEAATFTILDLVEDITLTEDNQLLSSTPKLDDLATTKTASTIKVNKSGSMVLIGLVSAIVFVAVTFLLQIAKQRKHQKKKK